MVSLGSWMNEILIDWGVDPKLANMFDETIIAVLMIGVSIGLDYLCQAIFVSCPVYWFTSYCPWPLCGEKRYWTSHRKYVRCISLLPYCSLSTACCW